jgi:hypothetical protein
VAIVTGAALLLPGKARGGVLDLDAEAARGTQPTEKAAGQALAADVSRGVDNRAWAGQLACIGGRQVLRLTRNPATELPLG